MFTYILLYLFFVYICSVISRKSILVLVAILSVIFCGEHFSYDVATAAATSNTCSTEMTIAGADTPNSSSLMSGQESSRSINNNRRHIQRNNNKRVEEYHSAQREDVGVTEFANSHFTIKSNLIGGVVADRAFYSLCCLRI